jgi:hypothetical protein
MHSVLYHWQYYGANLPTQESGITTSELFASCLGCRELYSLPMIYWEVLLQLDWKKGFKKNGTGKNDLRKIPP